MMPPDLRDNIHRALESNSEVPEAVLTQWVVVAEWLDIESNRWLTRIDGSADLRSLSAWQREGLLHNALHTDWEDPDEA